MADITIRGITVSSFEVAPVRDLRVEAWDKDLLFDDFLAETLTDEHGVFQLSIPEARFSELFFDRSPDLFFKIYDGGRLVLSTERSVLWNVRTAAADVRIEVPISRSTNPPVAPVTYHVSGRVVVAENAGVGGVRVGIVDKAIGGDVELAATLSDDKGQFRVTFNDASLKERGKRKPDLQAQAKSNGAVLGASAVHYDASTNEFLEIKLERAAAPELRSEHEALVSALFSHFNGDLADLEETDARQDVTYLANKSGWDARAVAFAVRAEQLSGEAARASAKLAPALFYALFRAGLPPEARLYLAPLASVASIWKQAIAQGVIPKNFEKSLPTALAAFEALAARRVLDAPAVLGVSPFKELIAVSLGDDDAKQQAFAALHVRHADDAPKLWEAVSEQLGEATEQRLKLDGKLAFLTLNNAPLMRKLHAAVGGGGLANVRALVSGGYQRPETWLALCGDDSIPPEIPGASPTERRTRYAEHLAAQVRLSFPTAVAAQAVADGQTPLATASLRQPVQAFLSEHEARFEIAREPLARYLARSGVQLEPGVAREISRIQRVYQLTPGDRPMRALLARGLDSALAVSRFEREQFVQTFKGEMGGEATARQVHVRATQIHNVTLNLAVSYLTAGRAPSVGVRSPPQIVDPSPRRNPHALDIAAYPTLDGLLGEQDYCACDHCRSVLSPAAYLVDLLHFMDRDDADWSAFVARWRAERRDGSGHEGPPYPFPDRVTWENYRLAAHGAPPNTEIRPLDVLLSRRPDLQHLPLTCENTNTPVPYLDLVNETLEYFVANGLSLDGYVGHSTDDTVTTDELLASPQFVQDLAYTKLAAAQFPLPLPFNQPLESLRLHFARFGVPLPEVMRALRLNDALENVDDYGWLDIALEELAMSRAEYALLTNGALTLQVLYGFADTTSESAALNELSRARNLTRRLGISYEELVQLLRTRFVNPSSSLLPKVERLGVGFVALTQLIAGDISDAELAAGLAPGVLPTEYGGRVDDERSTAEVVATWVRDNAVSILGLVTLMNPEDPADVCTFEHLELRYARTDAAHQLSSLEFVRLLRFVRLWRRLGFSIEQTDKAITALYPFGSSPQAASIAELDTACSTLVLRLATVKRVMATLELGEAELLPLLGCFAPLDTHGERSFYRQLFLSPTRTPDPAFADDGSGAFLTGSELLWAHEATLRAAFRLTGEELAEICAALGHDDAKRLGRVPSSSEFASAADYRVEDISEVFRRAWLARKLRLSVRELLVLVEVSGLQPFAEPGLSGAGMVGFIELVRAIRAAGLSVSSTLYLLWNVDVAGQGAAKRGEVLALARGLRSDFVAIEAELAIGDDPEGSVTREKMSLAYGRATTEAFFALVEGDLRLEVPYTHSDNVLETAITLLAPELGYDAFAHRLSHRGLLTRAAHDALVLVPGVPAIFVAAVGQLLLQGEDARDSFFARHPELEPLIVAYALSPAPVSEKRAALSKGLEPELSRRRKRQQALQRLAATSSVDLAFSQALLDPAPQDAARYPLHAVASTDRAALDDVLAVEARGLSADFFFGSSAAGTPDLQVLAAHDLDYSASTNPLPSPGPGLPVSCVLYGFIEAPETGLYNLVIDADASASVAATVGGEARDLLRAGRIARNTQPLALTACVLYEIRLTVEGLTDALNVQWEAPSLPRATVPGRYLYPQGTVVAFEECYVRFAKLATLALALHLNAAELAHVGCDAQLRIGGQSWLNHVPALGRAEAGAAATLLRGLRALLDFGRIKASLPQNRADLVLLLQEPAGTVEAPLLGLMRWQSTSFRALLARFGLVAADLAHVESLRRVFDAHAHVKRLGISAPALITVTRDRSSAESARAFQAALQARHDQKDWLAVIKPINDQLRRLMRDALVAFVLQGMSLDGGARHIDTPEKLFEYFLMDVQMDPCMQTSRIRHALSSVQLFIERCFLNLEARVAPSALDAERWQWMKRYRVWEANRKVFLYPENWLEPELRDDQSPIFKETMSELLQSDITEDSAERALLNYLAKLEEVAKLEPCGMYYEEPNAERGDAVHVVARAAGAGGKYFYRRREAGSWTPWEHIKLDIEDNPVLPVVWNGRLLLFWVRILKEVPLVGPPAPSDDRPLAQIAPADLGPTTPPMLAIKAILCWSEHYNGKWQPTRTSPLDDPAFLGNRSEFRRSRVTMHARESSEGLRIFVWDSAIASFVLYNTHSTPIKVPTSWGEWSALSYSHQYRLLHTYGDSMSASYTTPGTGSEPSQNFGREILTNVRDGGSDYTVEPQHRLQDRWGAPFEYADHWHAFYVTTRRAPVKLDTWIEFIPSLRAETAWRIPDLVAASGLDRQLPGNGAARVEAASSQIHDGKLEPTRIERFLSSNDPVVIGERLIGPAGSSSGGTKQATG